jgi:hypothetical protein
MGYVKVQDQPVHRFQKSCVTALNRITRETGAVIVVSSTWRFFGQKILDEHFKNEGVEADIIDVTPHGKEVIVGDKKLFTSVERGFEIQEWLDKNENLGIKSFTIIDDSSDMVHLMPKLVHTQWSDPNRPELDGLTEEKADEAIIMLMGTK